MDLEQLFDQKIILEQRILLLEEQLGDQKTGSLVDKDGFPLASIDHYSVATARSTLSRLVVDHGKVMKEIEARLPEALSSGRRFATKPFAIVVAVDRGSLADLAGLMVGDKLLMINDCITRFEDLSQFKASDGITVKLLRGESIIKLECPKQGHSVLGARLNKI